MTLASCILFWSFLNGVDPNVTKAVIQVESSGNPKAVGSIGEQGLMQIRPEFVKYSSLQLRNSCTNIMVGTEILGRLKKQFPLYPHVSYVSAYNLGPSKFRKIKYPLLFKYYKKVASNL